MEKVGCKGRLTLSINLYSETFTPFQWMAMDNQKAVEKNYNI